MFDLTSFWSVAWSMRDAIPPTLPSLFAGLILTGTYYLAASLVFPERIEDWTDLDAYFSEHKRQVLSGVFLCNVVTYVISAALLPAVWTFSAWIFVGAFLIATAMTFFSDGRRLNIILLSLLILSYLVPMFGL